MARPGDSLRRATAASSAARPFTLAPDWICGVLSPHTARLDRQKKKLAIYAREGVAHAWHAEPFEATSLALARLWVD